MRSIPLRAACLAACLIVFPPSIESGEPDGFVRIIPRWADQAGTTQGQEPAEAIPARSLTLEIEAIVPLAEARLILLAPEAISFTPSVPAGASFRIDGSGDGIRRHALDLGPPVKRVILEIEVGSPPNSGGIASFMVEGRTADGRSFSEGIGIAVGRKREAGRVRHGAVEFPAGTAKDDR